MSHNITYSAAEKASFKLCPETCPAVERAIDKALCGIDFTEAHIVKVFAKYNIVPDKNMRFAMQEVIGRALFERKRELADVVLYEGTFPLRAALVNTVTAADGLKPEYNHFEGWIKEHKEMKQYRAKRTEHEVKDTT